MAQEGVLRALAPGVLCRWQDAVTAEVRLRAASAWVPFGVMTGPAAARLTFWPEIGVPDIGISCRTFRPIQRGFTITRERIPEELVMDVAGCRVTVPALTALDLVSSVGGEGIDRVLRLRLASLDDMAEALRLTPKRSGNPARRAMLLDSRDEPWSEAEREGHRLLRVAGITGWKGNVPVQCGEALYFLDVGFQALKLGIEIDGRGVHRAENRDQFNHDRRKWTCVVNRGWTLLHFGADHVFDDAEFYIDSVRTALMRCRRRAS
jgi:very-short-patch-repair endonuclease